MKLDWEFTHTSAGGAIRHYRQVWDLTPEEMAADARRRAETSKAIADALGADIDAAKARGASVVELARADHAEPGIEVVETDGQRWRLTISGRRLVPA